MTKVTPDYLERLFDSDRNGLNLLSMVTLEKKAPKAVLNLKDEKEREVQDFIDREGREPSADSPNITERLLGIRLKNILKRNQAAAEETSELQQAKPPAKPWENSPLLDMVAENASIYDFSDGLVSLAAEREAPEYVAKATPFEDFERVKALFDDATAALKDGHRRSIQFRKADVHEGGFYIRKGVMFLVDRVYDLQKSKIREVDGRVHCIFANGTHSTVLLSSLRKSMYQDKAVTEDDREEFRLKAQRALEIFTPRSPQTGCVYVLKSLSHEPEVLVQGPDFYKIGCTSRTVAERIQNARSEPTYLCDEVKLVAKMDCHGVDAQKMEHLLHRFFSSAQVQIKVNDGKGRLQVAREWYRVPLAAIQEFVRIVNDEGIEALKGYGFEAARGMIVKRNVSERTSTS